MVDGPVHTRHASDLKLQFCYQCYNFDFISPSSKLAENITKKQFNAMMANTDTMIILRSSLKEYRELQMPI